MTYSKKFLAKHKVSHPDKELPIGYIYVIQLGNHFKIGKTKSDPTKRKKQLTLDESGILIYSEQYKDFNNIEKELHVLLSYKRVNNSEWFQDLDSEDFEKIKNWKNYLKINLTEK